MVNADLQKAKELLQSDGYTCVLCKGGQTHVSFDRGVKPLLAWLEQGVDLGGFSAADRVVGKAAACLYVLLEIRELYTPVVSQPALEVLRRYNIPCVYEQAVPAIRNRAGDGFCPMEEAVKEIDHPQQALQAIKITLQRLQSR